MMTTVSRILEESGRKDIVCVAAGSSKTGISLVLEGRLLATAYQSPVVDGEIAMQTIVDWFEGVPLEAVRYLPKHIITIRDAAEFIDIDPEVESLDLEILFRSIRNFDWQGTYYFFGDLYLKFIKTRVLPMEHFQGMCLEILTGIIHILKSDGLSVEDSLGNYDGMVKHLLKDKDVSSVLDWLNQLAQQAISRRMEKNNRRTPIQEIIDYIDSHISEPISIKTLSHQFKISHSYLGQMFKKETGIKFTDYLNAQRVEKAKIILKGRGVTINTVARDLGYTNPDYFYKVFKKLTGQSAGEFIRHQ
jgi:AraC-like DNA-binding protein